MTWAVVFALLTLGALLWWQADRASAAGTTRYVAKTGSDNAGTNNCSAQASPCLTISNALTHAVNGDTIQIGPGIFAVSVTTAKSVTFAGAGPGTASSFDPTKDTAIDAIHAQEPGITISNRTATIQGIRVRGGVMPDGNGGEVLPAVQAGGNSVPSLDISNSILAQASPPSPDVIDYALDADQVKATVENSIIDGIEGGIESSGTGGSLTLKSSSVITPTPAHPGLSVLPRAAVWALNPAAISDSRLFGIDGVFNEHTQVTAVRTLIGASGAGAVLDDTTANGPSLALRDSVIDVVGDPTGVGSAVVVSSTSNSEPVTPTLTLVGDTAFVRTDHAPAALNVSQASAGTTVMVRNTILHAIDTSGQNGADDILAGTHAINWNIGYSDYSEVAGQGVPAPGSTTNLDAPPGFVNDSGSNLHLSAASTLFDRGDPSVVGAGETDVTGAPRSVPHACGGTALPDLGAYEAATPTNCPPAGGGTPPPVPAISHFSQSHKKWRRGSKPAAITAAKHHKHKKKAPVGTTFSFTLNTASQVTLTFTESTKGRKGKGGKCVAQTKRNKHKHSCKRTIPAGTLSFASAAAGTDSISFDGKVSSHKKLKPGKYTVAIQATDSSGHSATSKLSFTVVKS